MRSRLAVLALVILAGLVAAATASARGDATDYADTALNIIPSGQYGGFPIVPEADDQAKMYDDLTPLFDNVTEGDLTTYFKSEALSGLGTDGPGTVEPTPNPDVTIVRDSFNVPHITADDEEDGIWAAGWLIAEDRGLLIQQARFNARVASIDAPGLSAIGLVVGLQNFQPSPETEAVVAEQEDALLAAGEEGEQVLEDIDAFIDGINDLSRRQQPRDR